MTRVAIIDHESHRLIVEDIDDEVLNASYNGDEEAYIKDMYTFDGEWSWDYIVEAEYYPMDYDDPIEIDFDSLDY